MAAPTAIIRLDVGASTGIDGRSREDGVAGTLVTMTSVGPAESSWTHAFAIYSSSAAVAAPTVSPTGAKTATMTPPVAGRTYVIELTVTNPATGEVGRSYRVLSVPTTNLQLSMPAPGERARDDARIAYEGLADYIAGSWRNTGASIYGHHPVFEAWLQRIDALLGERHAPIVADAAGTTETLVGSVYLEAGVLQSARAMIGCSNPAHAASLRLRRNGNPSTILTTLGGVAGGLADRSAGPITVATADWYDVYLFADNAGAVPMVRGLYLRRRS